MSSVALPSFSVAAPAAAATPSAPDAKADSKAQASETAAPAPEADRLAALQAELESQRIALDALRQQLTVEQQNRTAAERAAAARLQAQADADAARPPTLRVSRLNIGLTGFLQTDLPFRQSSEDQLNPANGDLLNQNRVYLRRGRLRVFMDETYGAGALELDANSIAGVTARVVGAEASLKLPARDGAAVPPLMLTIGLFKTPFGFEILQSDRDRLFMERSTSEQALFPGEYDGGVRLQGGWQFVRYSVAAVNGEPIGERSFPGRDPNKLKDLVGRLGVESRKDATVGGWIGLSLLKGYGFHRGTNASKDTLAWRDNNSNRIIDPGEVAVIPGAAASPSFNFDRSALGADAGVRVNVKKLGYGTLYAEGYLAKNLDRAVFPYDPSSPKAQAARELGWYVAYTQELTRHAAVGVRYDLYDPDRDASDTIAGRVFLQERQFRSLALVAAAVESYGRLMVEFDLNRNRLGRDVSGNLTNLKDNAVIVRGQVNF